MMEKIRHWSRKNIYYILAFVLPVCVAIMAFIAQGVWPFGDRGISVIDSYHQYVPFFSELQYKWKNWDSLFYSWNGGLGMNFLAVMAYYLASPLNILLLIFPKSLVMECFTVIYLLKIGLASLSFGYFIRKRFGQYDLSITTFGCMYGMSSFVIGYGWNIMWLDCIVLFPMVMLGIYTLIHDGKGWIYGWSLALCIFTNYYIAFMICIFSCIYLLIELSCTWGMGMKRVWMAGAKFAGYSLMAGGFAAILLLPTIYALGASASATSSFPTTLKFYHNAFELLCQQFAFIQPTDLSGNFNLYCGVAVLIFVPMFLFNKNIRPWDRIVKICVTVFLLVCLNTNYLTYIWHGFHFPNGLPGRYSFIYIFMLLIMAYEGFKAHKGCPKWLPSMIAGLWLVFLAYCCWGRKAELENYTVIVSIVLVFVYGVLIMLIRIRVKKWHMLEVLLLCILLGESCAYGVFGLCMNGTVNRKDYYSDQNSVMTLKNHVETWERENFYRFELEERRGRDDVTWHNLPGVSLFSSTVNAGVNQLIRRLGYYSVTNKYSYEGATPESDAFLNVKYLVSREKKDQIRTFEYVKTVDDRHLYINENALGLGFMVSEDILQWDYEKTNPFEVINQMMTSVMGEEIRPYTYFGLDQPVSDGCALTTDSWADWSYTATTKRDGTVKYTYIPEKSQELYIYFKAAHCSKVKVEYEGFSKSYSDEDGHIIPVGSVNAGQMITLTFEMDSAYESGSIKLIAAEHDSVAFERVVERMKQTTWITDEIESTRLSGTIRVPEEGIMFTSIPYEEGWSIWVDGKKVKPEMIADALLGIRLAEGDHTIEMSYMPQGFVIGQIITLMSSVCLIVVSLLENKGKCGLKYGKLPEQER